MLKKPITKETFTKCGRHCRHCGYEHSKRLRRSNCKDFEKLENDVLELLQFGVKHNLLRADGVTRESVADYFEIPEHQAEQVMQKLKLKGFLGTPSNRAPHDSTRDPMNRGFDSSWVGSVFPVRVETFQLDKAVENSTVKRSFKCR